MIQHGQNVEFVAETCGTFVTEECNCYCLPNGCGSYVPNDGYLHARVDACSFKAYDMPKCAATAFCRVFQAGPFKTCAFNEGGRNDAALLASLSGSGPESASKPEPEAAAEEYKYEVLDKQICFGVTSLGEPRSMEEAKAMCWESDECVGFKWSPTFHQPELCRTLSGDFGLAWQVYKKQKPVEITDACANLDKKMCKRRWADDGCVQVSRTECVNKDLLTDDTRNKMCSKGKKNSNKCGRRGKKFKKKYGFECTYDNDASKCIGRIPE